MIMGGGGVEGPTKQCSSGVPNTEPQLAAGPEPQDRPAQHHPCKKAA